MYHLVLTINFVVTEKTKKCVEGAILQQTSRN